MRISTNTIFENGVSQLGTLQSNIAKTQMQLSSNRRLLTAADDPIASARALEVTQSAALNEQYGVNRQNARNSLSQVSTALQSTTQLLHDVKEIAVKAGNGSYSQEERDFLAIELSGRLDDLMALANTADGAGGYLFSGYKSTTVPFTKTATGAAYHGDQGQRMLQVASGRQLAISDSGASVFEANPTGNGTFATRPGSNNNGLGVISSGTVIDVAALTGNTYELRFTQGGGTPPTASYSVADLTTGQDVLTNVPWTSGQQIAFDGMAFGVTGLPATGDVFTVKPSEKQSLFTTMSSMIDALRRPADNAIGQARLSNDLTAVHENLNAALDNVLGVQASLGTRLKELDNLDNTGADLNLQYRSTLSDLQDLDYVKALSDFAQQQFTLEAAQKSFKSLSGLSLFNYIG